MEEEHSIIRELVARSMPYHSLADPEYRKTYGEFLRFGKSTFSAEIKAEVRNILDSIREDSEASVDQMQEKVEAIVKLKGAYVRRPQYRRGFRVLLATRKATMEEKFRSLNKELSKSSEDFDGVLEKIRKARNEITMRGGANPTLARVDLMVGMLKKHIEIHFQD